MLRYLSDETWEKLPSIDFRGRFFVEAYSEKLRMQTPHFHQARLMNLFSACAEMLLYIQEYQDNEKNAAYVIASMKEILLCWDTDTVAQELFSEFAGLRPGLEKGIKSGDLGQMTLNRLRVFCRAILSRKTAYAQALLIALEDSVIGPVDISQKDRITSQIDRLTGLYTTHLLRII